MQKRKKLWSKANAFDPWEYTANYYNHSLNPSDLDKRTNKANFTLDSANLKAKYSAYVHPHQKLLNKLKEGPYVNNFYN